MKTAACASWPMSLAKNWPRPMYSRSGFWTKRRKTTARTSHAVTRPIRSTTFSIRSASRSSAFSSMEPGVAIGSKSARNLDQELHGLDIGIAMRREGNVFRQDIVECRARAERAQAETEIAEPARVLGVRIRSAPRTADIIKDRAADAEHAKRAPITS